MGVRSVAAVAILAVGLLGLTIAIPQDTHLGGGVPFSSVFGGGANIAGADTVGPHDPDLGKLLDHLDPRILDPALLKNLDPAALADMLERLSPEQLAALGLDREQALAEAALLRDPALNNAAFIALLAVLAGNGLGFTNTHGFGNLSAAYADLDGDGVVSEGDVRLGAVALYATRDAGLNDRARALLTAYNAAGAVGLDPPASAATRTNATAATAPLPVLGYPSDRGGGPLQPVCVQRYSLDLTCHQRTFVQGRVSAVDDYYLFGLDTTRTGVPLEPNAPGVRSVATLRLTLDPKAWTPVPTLTPGDRLVGLLGPSIELARDGNGMVWARGASGNTTLDITWAVDAGYFDLSVPEDVGFSDVPAASRPRLDSATAAVGLRIADLAGAQDQGYRGAVDALVAYFRAFRSGLLPDRSQRADDLLAVAQAQVGCARQRAEAFTLAAQALGVPARLVLNEAHAFSEVFVPRAGWRMVDLGGCGEYQVAILGSHVEVLARQQLPYARNQAPASVADPAAAPVTTAVSLTQSLLSARRGNDITVDGKASGPASSVPDGVPVVLSYNRTRDAPGTVFCATFTSGGTFRATCRVPSDAPVGNLRLVARLAPSVLDDAPSLASYADTAFIVQSPAPAPRPGPTRRPRVRRPLRQPSCVAQGASAPAAIVLAGAGGVPPVLPVALLAVVALLVLTLLALALLRLDRRRRARRNRFLPQLPPFPVGIVQPDLPSRVPRVFDPDLDRALTFRMPRSGAWEVRDEKGRPIPARAQGRDLTLDLRALAVGRHTLRLGRVGQPAEDQIAVVLSVNDLRQALDGATRALLARLGQPTPGPALLQAIEDGLRKGGAHGEDALAVRRLAEGALYDAQGCDRARFHDYFLALDRAQARRPA